MAYGDYYSDGRSIEPTVEQRNNERSEKTER